MATHAHDEEEAAPEGAPRAVRARISLCGALAVELDGRRVERDLPGRQGRLLLAYLVAQRGHPVSRDALVDLVWPHSPPAAPDASLRPLLTRLRRAVGDHRLIGRAQLVLDLGSDAWVDVEVAAGAAERAERLLAAGDAAAARDAAAEALAVVESPFLPDVLAPWAEERRQDLRALEAPLLEVAGRAALALGGAHRGEAERLARRLVEQEPYRESGHVLLMEALAAQGNVGEALRVFDTLRVRLREELGVPPEPGVTALHERLLRQETGDVEPIAPPRLPPARPAGAGPRPPLPPAVVAATGGAFVGRAEALELLERSWTRALSGSEQLVLVAGEPGVGKTRLLAQFGARQHAAGAAVLYGRCDEESLMPYQPIVEGLRHAVRSGARLDMAPHLAAELVRVVPELDPDADPDAPPAAEAELGERGVQRGRLFEAIATAIGILARAHGLLILVDDLHWADRTTHLLLRYLARIGGRSRAMMVAAYRDDEVGDGHQLTDLLAEIRRDRRFERLALAGLDEPETAALLAARVAAETSEGFARRLQAQTAGNPFFIEETLRGLPAAAARLDEDDLGRVPDVVGDVIHRRLGHVGEDVREVLAVAAVAGREFDLDVVAAALGRPEDDVLRAVEDALEARLVEELPGHLDRFAFCHALVREVLHDRQAASRRLRRHLAVADALERPGRRRRPPAAEVARHLVEAGPLAGADRVLTHLLAAADETAGALAYEEAAGHLGRALELLDADPGVTDAGRRRCDVLLALGRALWRAGDPDARLRLREAAALARREGLPEHLARAVLGMTGRFYEAGVVDRSVVALVEEALDGLGAGDSPLRARLLARLSDALHVTDAERRRLELSAEAVAMARRLADPDALTVALTARHAALLHVEHLDERLEISSEQLGLARARDRPEVLAIGLHWRIYDLLELGDGDAARRDGAELGELAAHLRQPLYRYLHRCWQGVWAQLEGRLDEAEELTAEAYALGVRAGARTADSTRVGALVAIRREQGRVAEIVERVRAAAAEHPAITSWRGTLPLVLAEAGLAGEARLLLDALEPEIAAIPRDLFWLTTMTILGDAAASAGSPAQQRLVHDLLVPYADRCVPASLSTCWGSAARVLGRLAAALGEAEEADRRFAAALAAEERLLAPVAVARTLRDREAARSLTAASRLA